MTVPEPRTRLPGPPVSATSRRRRPGWAGALRAAAVVVALACAAAGCGGSADDGPDPPPTPSLTASGTPTAPGGAEAIDTSSWTAFTSERYDVEMAHPEDWTVLPASRRWESDRDVRDVLSDAHDAFVHPDGEVRVSLWFVPIEPAEDTESIPYLLAWAEDYCRAADSRPCSGIDERAVELCLERRDCHPGLLVPFDNEVQAYFSGGIYDQEAMTVVSVWRPESHPSVAPYGGARRLLEAFLSTMQVWPATTPLHERRLPEEQRRR